MVRRSIFVSCFLASGLAGFYMAGPLQLQGQTTLPGVNLKADPVSFRDVVKGVLPAVVSVESKVNPSRNRRPNRSASEETQDDFRKYFEELERRQQPHPKEQPNGPQRIGMGSGFIIDPKGVLLTNNHVVESAEFVEITLTDGRKFTSTDIKGDRKTDIAIVRFDPKGAKLPFLELGDSSAMEIGDRVLAIGAPFGLSGTVTHGIISAKGRDLHLNSFDDFVQTDAAINPGNSGGPLVNLAGKVVGINSAIKSETGGFQGISMAISSNMAKGVMQALVRDGEVKRPYIGIESKAVDANTLAEYGATSGGVLVGGVRPKAPADKGGMHADDIVVSIDDQPIRDFRDLTRAIAAKPVGTIIGVGVVRDQKPVLLKITLEEEPEGYGIAHDGEPVPVLAAGMTLGNLPARSTGPRGRIAGAVVLSVKRGSAAFESGFRAGDVVLAVNRKQLTTATEVKDAIEENLNGDGVTIQTWNGSSVVNRQLKAK